MKVLKRMQRSIEKNPNKQIHEILYSYVLYTVRMSKRSGHLSEFEVIIIESGVFSVEDYLYSILYTLYT